MEKVRPVQSVHEWWVDRSSTIMRVEMEELSITACRRSTGDNETWW